MSPFPRAMANIVRVTDSGDPRIAAYTTIRERDLANGHGGRFIVEGKLALEALLTRGRFAIESLFLCETRLESLASLMARVPSHVPLYVAPQSVMDSAAGFSMHRGVLACGLKGKPRDAGALIETARAKAKSTLLILSDISNHDNIGALFRNAAAFDAECLLLDARCCDPLYRKAIRVSSGTSLWLPFHQGDDAHQLISKAAAAGFAIWTLTPHADASALSMCEVPDHLVLVLGAEGPGLPAQLISSGKPIRIPMQAGFDSVNVATAAAIALAHVFSVRT